jgi:hypothetical protein
MDDWYPPGLMRVRFASINDLPIKETERKYRWTLGRRPDDHLGLSDLGFQWPNPFTRVRFASICSVAADAGQPLRQRWVIKRFA